MLHVKRLGEVNLLLFLPEVSLQGFLELLCSFDVLEAFLLGLSISLKFVPLIHVANVVFRLVQLLILMIVCKVLFICLRLALADLIIIIFLE